ncbi:MAG: hypothetical protein FJ317_02390 [SAR202 cluster bacterium]|nr:hypothetical protein [SAR202 cluster bacterium]
MKGEIKQTLVDLRDFVMRQDSPFARRAAVAAGPSPAQEEQVRRVTEELAELRRQVASARASQQATPMPQQPAQQQAPAASQPAQAVQTAPAPGAPTVHVIQAGQPEAPARRQDSSRRDSDDDDGRAEPNAKPKEEQRAERQEQQRPSAPRPPAARASSRPVPGERGSAAPGVRRPLPRLAPRREERYEEEPALPRMRRPVPQGSRSLPQKGAPMQRQRLPMGRPAPGRVRREPQRGDWDEREEYRRMPEEAFIPGVPLDANLVASLMRWVGNVKRRLGAQQMTAFIEIYKMTGQLPLSVERILLRLSDMNSLPDESDEQIFTLDDIVDAMMQLHAIIHGPGQLDHAQPVDDDNGHEDGDVHGDEEEPSW